MNQGNEDFTAPSPKVSLIDEEGNYNYEFHNPYNFSIDDLIYELTGGTVRETIDEVLKVSSMGTMSDAYGKHLWGINHQDNLTHVPHNNEHIGLTFFTKPSLNFNDAICLNSPKYADLANNEPKSIQRAIRTMLDHRLALNTQKYPCPLNDPFQSFLPVLSNSLMTLSGVPSIALRSSSTPAGIAREEFTWVDDITENYTAYDVQCTFRNAQGNLLMGIFWYWLNWITDSYRAPWIVSRYIDDIIANRMVYTTRIYRVMLDHTKRYVTSIWAPGYAYPTGIDIGSVANYDIEKPINVNNKTLEITFRCSGSMFNSASLIEQFNQTVWMLNLSMTDELRDKDMVKIPLYALRIFSHRGYPRIDPNTRELQWYVSKADWASEASAINFLLNNQPVGEPL